MMKIVAPLIMCLLLTLPVLAQEKLTDREQDGFLGPVHTVLEESAPLTGTRDKPVDGAQRRVESRTYDPDGNLTEKIVYSGDHGQDVLERIVYGSDSAGNRTENIYITGSEIPASADGLPAPVKEDQTSDGSYLYKIQYKYDNQGNRTEEDVYGGRGALVYKLEYEYNEHQQMVKRQIVQADKIINRTSYSYLNAMIDPITETKNNGERISYGYAPDFAGNWTQRFTYSDRPKKGEIGEHDFRRITYYTGADATRGKINTALSSNIVRPLPLNKPSPSYTYTARKNGVQGIILVRVLVSKEGLVRAAIVTKGLPDGLNESAVIAASKLKFRPATADGRPVEFWVSVVIDFKLK